MLRVVSFRCVPHAQLFRVLWLPQPLVRTPVLLHDHNEYVAADVFLAGIGIYAHLIERLSSASLD